MSKKKPYNLLFDIYRLGVIDSFSAVFSKSHNIKDKEIEQSLDDLAKTHGYSLKEFDKITLPKLKKVK
jgi:hypothetical protein